MKVGTDAVLLGSWTDVQGVLSILDIGTGTGVLALMMAQKTNTDVKIDAVEIDVGSAQTAEINFENSPWKNRMSVFNMDIKDFTLAQDKQYDLIICNPPFFEDSLLSHSNEKNLAKHNVKLNYKELADNVFLLLKGNARFCVVLPFDKMEFFGKMCINKGLKCTKATLVIPLKEKQPNRVLLEWQKISDLVICKQNNLCIRNKDNTYTEDYLNLTKDFLLISHNVSNKKY